MDAIKMLFDTTNFMPHGHCYLWTPSLLWTYVLSDALIGASYYSIPAALTYLVWKRKDLSFNWMFKLFSLFIVCCGTTHFISILTIWRPDYYLDASVKAVTAGASLITAILLWPVLPKILRIPTPVQLHAVIANMHAEVETRKAAEMKLAHFNETLESRVQQRTRELAAANISLQEEMTARQQTDRALRENEERFRAALAATSDIVWTNNAHGEMTGEQRGWEAYTGQSFEEYQHLGWSQAVHPDDVAVTVNQWKEAVATASAFVIEHRLRRRDGIYRNMQIRAVPVKNTDGSVREWVGVHRDITIQRESETQRGALLERERAARNAAEQASRTKDEFLANVSHELRTPLNAMLGWASVLLASPQMGHEDLKKGLATIERNARLQAQIIEDLLDMNRILSGNLRLDVKPVDVQSVLHAAVETVQPAANAKAIRVEANVAADLILSGDSGRLQQVFWNLLSNAVKFTPRGGKVAVATRKLDSLLEITVQDDGIGIAPDFLPQLFERFRQADASTSRAHGGLGLGLAIVKELVELHGGSVSAVSKGEGKGARFSVYLPMIASQTSVEQTALTELKITRRVEPSLGGAKVLIVDDERDTRDLLKKILTERGATVVLADSTDEALSQIANFNPDLLISDIGMPERDGYDLIGQLRNHPDWNAVPAIALTAFAMADDRMQAVRSGYQAHLGKPVMPADLIDTVAALLDR
jgi:PAS domain S-box-containing protein